MQLYRFALQRVSWNDIDIPECRLLLGLVSCIPKNEYERASVSWTVRGNLMLKLPLERTELKFNGLWLLLLILMKLLNMTWLVKVLIDPRG